MNEFQTDGIRDLDDPDWTNHVAFVPPGTAVDGVHPGVRLINEAIDFLHGLEDDIEDWWKHQVEHGKRPPETLPAFLKSVMPYKPNAILMYSEAAESHDLNTFTIDVTAKASLGQGYTEIVRPRRDRFRVVVTNWGPGILWVSSDTNFSAGNPNAAQIPVNGFREFRSKGPLYATPTAATIPVCDVQDEYGYEERGT